MRKLRLLLLVFFLVVFVIFMATNIHEYLTSDYTAPVIAADTDVLHVSVSANEADLLVGMSASDNLDGDVSDSLVVVSQSKFIAPNTRHINYAAFDGNNNVGTYSRDVVYTDYHPPRFVLSEPLRFVAGNTSYDYLRSLRAMDVLDGDISSQIKITYGDFNTASDSVSVQKIILQVTNSAGDKVALELNASFEDFESFSKVSPALTDYIIYVQKGEKPNLRAYLDGIWTAGNHRKFSDLDFDPDTDISIIDNRVNYGVPGVYTVTYRLSKGIANGGGGVTRTDFGTTTLYVVVEDAS